MIKMLANSVSGEGSSRRHTELPELAGQDRDKRTPVKAQMILASIRGLFFSRVNRHLKISSLGLVEEATHQEARLFWLILHYT